MGEKFDVAKLERLNDPGRFETLKPDAMWESLGNPQPSVIVDVGAGTGLFAVKLLEFAPGATVYALDSAPAMVDWMREHRPQVADGRLVPLVNPEDSIPLDDCMADLAVMINIHHEVDDPPALYAETLRVLRPGGQLLMVDWAPKETPKGPSIAIRISAEEAIAFAQQAGFSEARSHDTLPWHWLVTAVRP